MNCICSPFAAVANSPMQAQSISSSCASSPQQPSLSSIGGSGSSAEVLQHNSTTTSTATGNAHDATRLVLKCAHFFKSLSRFKSTVSQEQHQRVLQLLREGVTSEMSADEFSAKLREVTGSQDKGTLLPFLKLALPLLRESIRNGEQTELQQMLRLVSAGGDVEGISPDDSSLPSPSLFQQQQSAGGYGAEAAPPLWQQQQISRSVPPQSLQQQPIQTAQIVNVVRPLSVQNSLNPHSPATSSTTFVVHRTQLPPPHQQQSVQKSAAAAAVVATPFHQQQQVQAVPQQQQLRQPLSVSSSTTPAARESASAAAQMAPECLQNLPPMLLNPQALADRILAHMPEAQGVDAEVLSIISMAAEARLRSMLEQLAVLAEHRQAPLRIDPHYALVDEPRKQMRFMEDIERRAHENRETAEKEAMLRTAKSKGKDRDAVEKAKQMQKADREAMVNREANLAAFAALGGNKTCGPMKRPFGAPSGPGGGGVAGGGADWKSEMQNQGTTEGLIKNRPPLVRVKRVTMRDLQFFLSNDPLVPSNSRLRHRIALSTLSVDENNATNI
uniref:TAFH domain-containing protein n=1 Tax=Globodera rostochiensis TaxID=31243 RepID=A0A914I272_GLORO